LALPKPSRPLERGLAASIELGPLLGEARGADGLLAPDSVSSLTDLGVEIGEDRPASSLWFARAAARLSSGTVDAGIVTYDRHSRARRS
jgi:hypothetical protein